MIFSFEEGVDVSRHRPLNVTVGLHENAQWQLPFNLSIRQKENQEK